MQLTDKKLLAHMEEKEKDLFERLTRLRKEIQKLKDEIAARKAKKSNAKQR